jgi:hypothetical protein
VRPSALVAAAAGVPARRGAVLRFRHRTNGSGPFIAPREVLATLARQLGQDAATCRGCMQ